jgi:hypothetical protein
MAEFDMLPTWIRIMRYTNAYHPRRRLSILRCADLSVASEVEETLPVSELELDGATREAEACLDSSKTLIVDTSGLLGISWKGALDRSGRN